MNLLMRKYLKSFKSNKSNIKESMVETLHQHIPLAGVSITVSNDPDDLYLIVSKSKQILLNQIQKHFIYPQRAVKVHFKDWKVDITFMDHLRINTESYT